LLTGESALDDVEKLSVNVSIHARYC